MRDPADVLQATFNSFTTKLAARADFRLPSKRQLIAVGGVAYDCEQLVVHAITLYQGTPGVPQRGYQINTHGVVMFSMDIGVTLVRPSPVDDGTGRMPKAADVTSSALCAASDAAALADTFYAAMADDSIAGPCDFAYFGGIEWIGPSGGLVGTMLTLGVQL